MFIFSFYHYIQHHEYSHVTAPGRTEESIIDIEDDDDDSMVDLDEMKKKQDDEFHFLSGLYLPTHISIYLSLSIYLSVCLFIYLSIIFSFFYLITYISNPLYTSIPTHVFHFSDSREHGDRGWSDEWHEGGVTEG